MIDLTSPYFNDQIITYLGNKRSLLKEIDPFIVEVSRNLHKEKLVTLDIFSGSGIVARLLKQHSSLVIANDLEKYSMLINEVFLSNKEDFSLEKFNLYLSEIEKATKEQPKEGVITSLYAPKDDNNIKQGERVFYTHNNAVLIDSYRFYIEKLVPAKMQKYFLVSLCYFTNDLAHHLTPDVFILPNLANPSASFSFGDLKLSMNRGVLLYLYIQFLPCSRKSSNE